MKTRRLKPDKIIWNRDDLKDKMNVNQFMEDVKNNRSISLKIWGPTRSGKTWTLQYIEKELNIKCNEDIIILYTDISPSDPTLDSFYRKFIDAIIKKLPIILPKIEKEIGTKQSDWETFFLDPELGAAMYYLRGEHSQKIIALQWIKGEKVSASILRGLNIISALNKSKKMEVMLKLIEKISSLFESCVLMVDEIGLIRPPSAARNIGDILKTLLDAFSEKFGLICTYSASLADALIDQGFSEHFYKRFDYDVQITSLPVNYVPTFLSLHHSVYRIPDYPIKDQLEPFTKDSINKILQIISEPNYYPGPILHTCGALASEALRVDAKIITPKLIEENINRIPKNYLR